MSRFVLLLALLMDMMESIAATAYTSHYYTTAAVAAANISCLPKVYAMKSTSACARKCSSVSCYKFVFKNGLCNITERMNSPVLTRSRGVFFKKVM